MVISNALKPNPNSIIVAPTELSSQIILIDSDSQPLRPLHEALKLRGYSTRLFYNADEALAHLSKTDILLTHISILNQPKAGEFVKAAKMLVLADKQIETLPVEFQADHIFLLKYSKDTHKLIDRLSNFIAPPLLDPETKADNIEHLALLFNINQSLSGQLEINALFERILALAAELKADFAALLVQEGDETIYYRSTQPGREELIGLTGRRFAQRLLKDGLEGWVLRHNQAAVISNTMNDSRWFRASYLPEEEHCVIALPFTLERVGARGVYLVGHKQPGYFTKEDVPLMEAVIIQIGMAIENAMLFKNQSERSVQLSLINEVSRAATSILNLDVMLRTVVQAIRRSFVFYSVSIHLYSPATHLVELRARDSLDRFSLTAPIPSTTHKLRQGLIGWSAATNKTIVANDVTQDPRYIAGKNNKEVRAELCVPIRLGTKTIGVLDIQSTQLEAFDKYHISALETLADQLAIAIENARLYDEINQRLKELQSLNDIGQAITSTLDLQKTLTLITDHTTQLMNVAAASVVLRDDEAGEVWFAAASGEGSEAVIGLHMALGQGLAGWVADKGEAVIVPDVYADQRFFPDMDKTSGFTTQSILCVPLQTKGHTIGAIEVMNKKSGEFNKEDLALLQALAAPAAAAIENAQLYEEQSWAIKRLAETQRQLVQSAKLAGVGELAAGIAHEINNPLTTIIGLTSLLLDTKAPTTQREQIEDLQMVNREARRARDIVRGLLNFARADTPKREVTNLNRLIEECIFLVYTKSISHKIELRKSLEPLPEMSLDVNQMKQVIVNLLNNAIQAMQNNGDRPAILTVSTTFVNPLTAAPASQPPNSNGRKKRKRILTDTTPLITSQQDSLDLKAGEETEPTVVCKISDTGHGIQPEHIDKIFDPFFTTKEVGQGTGLGLSISYGIMEKHGGHITVESTRGEGTIFSLTFPISAVSSVKTQLS
ncbi:MAG: GAF domain-containing protein [Anaerolineales bacterium]|nr:GAF domain-containing protein [Anaerolineales bacterium]